MKYLPMILFVALLGVGCKSEEASTKEILNHHWMTFRNNDLEGTLADYTEDSILITPTRTFKGLREIRENFESAFVTFPKGSSTMQLNKSVVQRDVGYILWEATGPKIKLTFGTDTFIIRNGKIISQTYGGVATNL
jgi:hypothetical protein